jgi:hypothetical protein
MATATVSTKTAASQFSADMAQIDHSLARETVELGFIGNWAKECWEVQRDGNLCGYCYHDCSTCGSCLSWITCIRPLHHLVCCIPACGLGACEAYSQLKQAKVTLVKPQQQTMT